MSEKYCPAGKCECGNYTARLDYCSIGDLDYEVKNFEQCPWPSRQVRDDFQCDMAKKSCNIFASSLHTPECFACGRASALREAVEAVEKLRSLAWAHNCHTDYLSALDAALNALRGMEVKP